MNRVRSLALRIARDIWHNGRPCVPLFCWDDLPYRAQLWYESQQYQDMRTGDFYYVSWLMRECTLPSDALPLLERVWEKLPTVERLKPLVRSENRATLERLADTLRSIRSPTPRDYHVARLYPWSEVKSYLEREIAKYREATR